MVSRPLSAVPNAPFSSASRARGRSASPTAGLVSRVLVTALALGSAGCGKACNRDHPYVPYSVGDETRPPATADGGSAASALDGGDLGIDGGTPAALAEPALLAPEHATTWRVGDLELAAPPGRELVMAIVRDLDGDGKNDALAIVRSPAPAGKPSEVGPAEIVFQPAGAPPRVLVTAPAPRTDVSCTPIARLERIGPRSALAEVGAACASGGAARALYVVRLARDPAVAFDLGIVDPPSAPRLAVDVDGADRDHDGIDDVTLHLTIEGGGPPFEPGPKLTAKVAFFDRSAGPSRDTEEPDASLRAIASHLASRAGKAKDAATVPVAVQQMRMLYRAMCVEGGAPRLVKVGGTVGAVTCGSSKPLEDAGVAEVRAFVTLGDSVRATAAAETAQIAPATRTKAGNAEIDKLLAQVAPIVQARSARVLGVAVPAARAAHPEWGPLAFEPSGKLLVRSASGVQRVDPDTGDATDAEQPAWPTQVLAPDGKSRWLEAYHACEGVALRATFAPTGDEGEMRDVLLPVAPPLGSRCAGGRGEAAATLPIAWGPRGLEVLVAGQPLLVRPEAGSATVMASLLGEMPPFGSPRSAGGRALAVATPTGVLVKAGRSVRYRAPELAPYAELRQCTTVDDASRIACAKRGKVVVATFDPL
ncbi:MAG: hypothetical protein JWP97_1777 [Labilithrix sp.]|nr:hypothetical protein [Labilithrix sp.]